MLALRNCYPKTFRLGSLPIRSVHNGNTRIVVPARLHYEVDAPEGSDYKTGAVIILHGLFGSRRNWNSLGKAMAERSQRPIYRLDLRNHGTSPHAEPMNYSAMAEDVWDYIMRHELKKVTVLGHSMGGKVAMAMALGAGRDEKKMPKDVLDKLIVVDITPRTASASPKFAAYIDTMLDIERNLVKTKKEADEMLQTVEKHAGTRAFLLTNLLPIDRNFPKVEFRPPLDRSWDGKALFIKGETSNYIKLPWCKTTYIDQFFPNNRLETLNAGHWGERF
ncbi:alpha/beta-hydrolase [Ephemerocybe angulata]|uniref:Alpha/beta-hydrolase n=1 Tax=Ephemerocybe angulata TaxID=980116 RepID=A0A8H6I6I4_9AGAR|nr:alpha/beta-hydrolase [Tulosesus angulatus]